MIKTEHALTVTIMGMLVISWFCLSIIDDRWEDIDKLNKDVARLEDKVEALTPESHSVTATLYYAVRSQTDKDPHITADGTRLNTKAAGKYRFIAVSRNLLKDHGGFLSYGDYIIVQGVNGKYDGIWQVKDTMNRRFRDRIDFLTNPNTKLLYAENVSIYKVAI
jgi:hypothetical protein